MDQTVAYLRANTTDLQRVLLDKILDAFGADDSASWPTVREVQVEFGKPEVEAAIAGLPPGTIYVENSKYQISLLGALLSTKGPLVERLLVAYLEFMRTAVKKNPKLTVIRSDDFALVRSMTDEESRLLRAAIAMGLFWGSQNSLGSLPWSAGVPEDVVDLLGVTDLRAFIHERGMSRARRLAEARSGPNAGRADVSSIAPAVPLGQPTKTLWRRLGSLSPYHIFADSVARVPGLSILFGVVGTLAILAIARVWALDRGWTVAGGIAVVVFAFVLLSLARLSKSSRSSFAGPAQVLLWFCILLFIAWAILLTTCVFVRWPVPVSTLPLSPVRSESVVPIEKPYDATAFSVVDLATMIDLTDWRPVSPEQMRAGIRVSESREHTVYRLRKTNTEAEVFRVVVYTPGLPPEPIPDPRHRLVRSGRVDYVSRPGTDKFDKYEFYFDVSNEPVGQVFSIDYEMIRWNTHQGKPHWWHGKVIDYPTEKLTYSFKFPSSRPSASNVLVLKDYEAVTETPLRIGTDYLVKRSDHGQIVTFSIPHPRYRFGYLYYFGWWDAAPS